MPTFVHGISAELSVNGGTALEGTLTSADMSLDRSLAEIKALAGGQVARVAGLKDCTFTASGAYDATVDAALFAAWDGAVHTATVFSPDGTVTYTLDCWIASYKITASSDAAVTYSISLSGDGDVARA